MTTAGSVAVHPLSPLSPEECEQATQILKRAQVLTSDFRFVMVDLDEPSKAETGSWPEQPLPRRVSIVGFDTRTETMYEAIVCLGTGEVTDWRPIPGAQPPMTLEEWQRVKPLLTTDPRWQGAMRKRGVTDFDLVHVDPWGGTGAHDPAGRRVSWVLTYVVAQEGGNAYARPVAGLIALVDPTRMEVIDVIDDHMIPIPQTLGEYIPELMLGAKDNRPAFDELRTDIKPIEITQPEGPSFRVDGHRVEWQGWSFVAGWTIREGLVLYDVAYDDRGDVRPILHRAAVCELVVPYADPSPTQAEKLSFDVGEFGLGMCASKLSPGCDCLGEIHYFDGLRNDERGNAVILKNAVCMHEEDVGLAWKQIDTATGHEETRRMRRLVVSFIASVGHYVYGFFWYFYQDGSIELEVKLNGIMQTGALRPGETPRYGTKIGPDLYAPNHQHFFCARLDVTVDGPNNTVTEVDSITALRDADNPHGNAWVAKETPLLRESEAMREVSPSTARFWRITNPRKTNNLGTPTAYRLIPGTSTRPLHAPDSPILARMAFTAKHLWVTPVRKDEMYPAGKYPWQNPGPDGLPRWTQEDRPIADGDIAVWYVFGSHHVPRIEEWPVMPVDRIGFALKPDGFFDGNPALNLPRPTAACHAPARS